MTLIINQVLHLVPLNVDFFIYHYSDHSKEICDAQHRKYIKSSIYMYSDLQSKKICWKNTQQLTKFCLPFLKERRKPQTKASVHKSVRKSAQSCNHRNPR